MIIKLFKKSALIALLLLCSSSLHAMQEKFYIGAGNNSFPPFEFIDEYGRPSGFNVDIINAIAAESGLNIRIILMDHDEAIEQFSAGKKN